MSVEIVEGTGPLVEPLPFTGDEYARRLDALRADMAAAGLDAFVAFGPENINYLTGHDTPAYQYLQACLVTHDRPPVNLLRSIDASNTLLRSGRAAPSPTPITTTRWARAISSHPGGRGPRAGRRHGVPPGARFYLPGRLAVVISEQLVAVTAQGAKPIMDFPRPLFTV